MLDLLYLCTYLLCMCRARLAFLRSFFLPSPCVHFESRIDLITTVDVLFHAGPAECGGRSGVGFVNRDEPWEPAAAARCAMWTRA